jgi:hypothetical protein
MYTHLAKAVYSWTGAIVGVPPNVAAGLDVVKDHCKEGLKLPGSEIPYWRTHDCGSGEAVAAIIVSKAIPCGIAVLDLELAVENVAHVLAVLENSDEIALCGAGDPPGKVRTKIHGQVRS